MPDLNTVANISTIVLAVVALLFAINNYMLFGWWRFLGWSKRTWPIEAEIICADIKVYGVIDGKPSQIFISLRATFRPFHGAWNPRRPIRIHSMNIRFRGSTNPIPMNQIIEPVIERETNTQELRTEVDLPALSAADQIALLEGGELTLEVTTTQVPRSIISVQAKRSPDDIQSLPQTGTGLPGLIKNLNDDIQAPK